MLHYHCCKEVQTQIFKKLRGLLWCWKHLTHHTQGWPTQSFTAFLSFLTQRKTRSNCSLWTSDLKERRESGVCMHVHGWRWLVHIQRHISMLSVLIFNSLLCQGMKKLFFFSFLFPTLAFYSLLQAKIRQVRAWDLWGCACTSRVLSPPIHLQGSKENQPVEWKGKKIIIFAEEH